MVIKLDPDNLIREMGEQPRELRLGLVPETVRRLERHAQIGNKRGGRRGTASAFTDVAVWVMCSLLDETPMAMIDTADRIQGVLGENQQAVDNMARLAKSAKLLATALERRAADMRWALAEMPTEVSGVDVNAGTG